MKHRVEFRVDVDADNPVDAAKAALLVLRHTAGHAVWVAPMPDGFPVHGESVKVVVDDPPLEAKKLLARMEEICTNPDRKV